MNVIIAHCMVWDDGCVHCRSPDEEWPNDEGENITNGINDSATAEPTE